MLLSLGRYVFFGMVGALAAAAGGTLAPAGPAAAQPQPTMVLSPASGPCDATVEITGQDFPPNAAIELGVGGTDGQLIVGHLGSVLTDGQGRLSLSALLGFLGCTMAGVTKNQNRGDQLWLLGYVLDPGPYGPAARTIARAPYTFTTTESTLPIATLTLSPSSGPCDATVEARGVLFEPGSDVTLQLARPNSEGFMGTLAAVTAGQGGGFVVSFALGTLGCEAAALDAMMKNHGEIPAVLIICGGAYQASICAEYASTTTAVTSEGTPIALPQTGQGGTAPGMDIRPLAVVALLLGVLLFTSGFVAARRKLR